MAEWPKTINVDKKIVPLLSEATYTNLYQVIREFVNNGYDADATRVDINIDSKRKFIEISDNGSGMTHEEFGSNFLTIAHTPKERGDKTKYGRPIVGQFGVGYLSATRFCKNLKIESTVEDNPEIFEANIQCEEFLGDETKLVWQIPVPGRTYKMPSKKDESYTKITLDDLTPLARSFFERTRETKKLRSSVKGWGGYEAFKWKLQQILPLEYDPKAKFYSECLEHDFGMPMEVYLDGERLYRNRLEGDILDKGYEKIGDDIEFKYVILTPWKTVKPMELVGLQTRLHNVGIGLPNLFGASFLTGHLFVTTRWICGEIQIIKGLEKDLSISRNGFNESEDYNNFFNLFHEKMLQVLNETELNKPSKRKLGSIEREIEILQEMLIKMKNRVSGEVNIPSNVVVKEIEKPSASYMDKIYDKLGKPGVYDVELVKYSGDLSQDPIYLDTDNKKLRVVEDHPALKEHIFVENKDFLVQYDAWDIPSETLEEPVEIVCKIDTKNNELIFNQNFRLFQDKTHGDLYKEVFAILAYTIHVHPENKKVNNFIARIITMNYLTREGLI